MPPRVSEVHPSTKLCCWKSVRTASKQGRSTSARKRQSAGAMRQAGAPKERHEGRAKGSYALKEVSQRPFPTDGIAWQQRQKIDGFIAAKASAHQTHLMGKGIQHPIAAEVASHDDDFGKP